LNGNVRPDNLIQTQAALLRIEAMRGAVIVRTSKGVKAHIWLSPVHVEVLTASCGPDLQGRRDWIILGLLLGSGLRREEQAELKFSSLKQQPTKRRARTVIDVTGKGGKSRVIPLSKLLSERLSEWRNLIEANDDDFVAVLLDVLKFLVVGFQRLPSLAWSGSMGSGSTCACSTPMIFAGRTHS
jgi:integrase